MNGDFDLKILLNRLQDQIKTGQVVIVLGPNTGLEARTLTGAPVLSQAAFVEVLRREFGITNDDSETSSLDDILDYCMSVSNGDERLADLIKVHFTCRYSGSLHRIIPNFVWHRIYSFDISNALELAYRQNHHRNQSLVKWILGDPITPPRQLSEQLELIKLYGDAENPRRENFLNTPGYLNRSARSRWYDQMLNDIETHPVIFLGEDGDLQHLIAILRRLRTAFSASGSYLVTPKITVTTQVSVTAYPGCAVRRWRH
jgi:hypothetical protein